MVRIAKQGERREERRGEHYGRGEERIESVVDILQVKQEANETRKDKEGVRLRKGAEEKKFEGESIINVKE